MEFLSLQPANFSSNRIAALHSRNLGPPWFRIFLGSLSTSLSNKKGLICIKGSLFYGAPLGLPDGRHFTSLAGILLLIYQ